MSKDKNLFFNNNFIFLQNVIFMFYNLLNNLIFSDLEVFNVI